MLNLICYLLSSLDPQRTPLQAPSGICISRIVFPKLKVVLSRAAPPIMPLVEDAFHLILIPHEIRHVVVNVNVNPLVPRGPRLCPRVRDRLSQLQSLPILVWVIDESRQTGPVRSAKEPHRDCRNAHEPAPLQ